jgi:hypothetical protein
MAQRNQNKGRASVHESKLEREYRAAAAEYDAAWDQTNSDGLEDEDFDAPKPGDSRNFIASR